MSDGLESREVRTSVMLSNSSGDGSRGGGDGALDGLVAARLTRQL